MQTLADLIARIAARANDQARRLEAAGHEMDLAYAAAFRQQAETLGKADGADHLYALECLQDMPSSLVRMPLALAIDMAITAIEDPEEVSAETIVEVFKTI